MADAKKEGEALLRFILEVDNAAALANLRAVRAELTGAIREQRRASRAGVSLRARMAASQAGMAPPASGRAPGDLQSSPAAKRPPPGKKLQGPATDSASRFASIGAEGLRVGHVRLSRSGLSLSEKTIARSLGPYSVIGGQVAGRVVQTIGHYAELRRQGTDVDKALYVAGRGAVAGLMRMGVELFGFRQFAEGFNSIFGTAPAEDFTKLYNETWEHGLNVMRRRADATRNQRASDERRHRAEFYNSMTKMHAEQLQWAAGRSDLWAMELRAELAENFSEQRAMTRTMTGRPLWKVVGYVPGEGVG